LVESPITCYGVLHVGVHFDHTFLENVYRLDVEKTTDGTIALLKSEPMSVDGLQQLGFDRLSAFRVDPSAPSKDGAPSALDQVPASIKRFDGQKVVIAGYAIGLSENKPMPQTEFWLVGPRIRNMLEEGVAYQANDLVVVHLAKATVIQREAFVSITGTLHLKERFDKQHELTSIYQLEGETVQVAEPRSAATSLPPGVPVTLAPEVQTAAVAAYQAAAALKTDYLKLHARLTKDTVVPGSPVAALEALLARAASSHIGYPEVTLGVKADLAALKVAVPAGRPNDYWVETIGDHVGKPLTFVDDKTGFTFYVEADGRHVTAMSPTGTILWRRDPLSDSNLGARQVTRAVIRAIGRDLLRGDIEITFDKASFGAIDPATGNFLFLGQD